MLKRQKYNQIDFSDNTLILPEQVDFYLQDKNDFRLVPENDEKVVVPRNLKDVVEKSDLFTEEDRRNFVFE